ncbi:MAG: EthD family reductase [Chloroflexi bacterium]|nr:EthD family reductase [Chloroflexota bacterium]
MFKFVTIYRKVNDEQKLEDFFTTVHLPLAEALPNLVKREISRVIRKPGGQSRYYLMVELYFESEAAFKTAVATETGVKLIQALTPWAEARLITWFFAEAFEE